MIPLSRSKRSLLHLNSVLIAEDAIGFATFCAFVTNTDPIRIRHTVLSESLNPVSIHCPAADRSFVLSKHRLFVSIAECDSTYLYVSLPIYIFSFIPSNIWFYFIDFNYSYFVYGVFNISVFWLFLFPWKIKFKRKMNENISFFNFIIFFRNHFTLWHLINYIDFNWELNFIPNGDLSKSISLIDSRVSSSTYGKYTRRWIQQQLQSIATNLNWFPATLIHEFYKLFIVV